MADPDFIEVFDGALDARVCRTLLQRFEGSGQSVRGSTGSGVNLKLKDSWDIPISGRREWADAERALNLVVLAGLKRYLRKYAHAVLAPLQLQMPDPATGELVMLDAERVATLDDGVLDHLIFRVFRPGSINLQKYIADQGGYPYWHCELYPKADNSETLHRVVLWTIYLNDGFREGETEFLYQNRRIAPKTGSLLIAPSAFTHTHRGNMPKGEDKSLPQAGSCSTAPNSCMRILCRRRRHPSSARIRHCIAPLAAVVDVGPAESGRQHPGAPQHRPQTEMNDTT